MDIHIDRYFESTYEKYCYFQVNNFNNRSQVKLVHRAHICRYPNQNTGNDWEPFWQNSYERNFWSQLGHKCWSHSMCVGPCSMNDFRCSCIQSYVLELCSCFRALLPFWETRVSFLTDAGGNWILLIKVQLRTSFHKGEKKTCGANKHRNLYHY